MACTTSTVTIESASTSSVSFRLPQSAVQPRRAKAQRRHTELPLRRSASAELDPDTIFLKVDLFVSEIERRLERIEQYGNLGLDAGIARAFSTLSAVRDSCSHVSGELIGAGRRRASILVETFDKRYNDALATRETLEGKAQTAMRMMEDFLADLESRATAAKDSSFSDVRRMAEEGVQKAKDVVDDTMDRARRAKATLKESIETAIQQAKQHRLITYDDLPGPWRVNPYITRGYRFSENKLDCFKSVFNYSNETVNIWSHAVGLCCVLAVAFYFYPSSINFSQSSKTDIFFAAAFFFAAVKCLACSCIWHTMSSISEQTLMERFACVDYTGISLLIAASIMTTEHTAFYCDPYSRWIYISMTALLGAGGVILPWHPTFNRADLAWLRVGFYVSLAATGFAPVLQLSLTRSPAWAWAFYAPIIKSIAVYLAGAIIYASQVPERWLRGYFDYAGGSHNIWHLAVLGGIFYHSTAMQSFFSAAFLMGQGDCRPDLLLQMRQ